MVPGLISIATNLPKSKMHLNISAFFQDFVTAYRGMRNCLWLQSPNIVKVRESDVLKETKAKYRQEQAGKSEP